MCVFASFPAIGAWALFFSFIPAPAALSFPQPQPLATGEEPLQTFGTPRYPDFPVQLTWGDLRENGRLGAICDMSTDASAQCGRGLVCRKNICRRCIEDKECPSLHRCQPEGERGLMCVPTGKRAWEQAFSEPFEGLCTFLIFFASALAAAAGTGGGGMFVPLLVSFSGLKAESAVPLSQGMILCGSIVNLSVFLAQRHPENKAAPLIDYNCVVLFEPMLCLGVTLGVLVNQMAPQWLLLILLCGTLGFSLWRCLEKGLKQLKAERDNPPVPTEEPRGVGNAKAAKSYMASFVELSNKNSWQVMGTVVVWLIMLVAAFHGLNVCTGRFGFFLVLLSLLLFACSSYAASSMKKPTGYDSNQASTMVDWVPANKSKMEEMRFPIIAFGAGFLGGLLGLGGGIILSPVLLEVGMHSEAVQATTAVFVFLSSSLATIQFAVLGQHVWHYVLWYAGVCTVATMLGQQICEVYVRRRKRYSLITLAIAGVLLSSLVALVIVGSARLVEDLQMGKQMGFSAARLCNNGAVGIVAVDVLPSQNWPNDLPQPSDLPQISF